MGKESTKNTGPKNKLHNITSIVAKAKLQNYYLCVLYNIFCICACFFSLFCV